MRESAVFVTGALLGGVFCAACGFDLYPVEEAAHSTLVALENHNADLARALDEAREERRRVAELRSQDVEAARRAVADLMLVRGDLEVVRAENQALESRLDDASARLREITEELALVEDESKRLLGELALSREDVALARADLFAMALRFFAVPRPESDRDLAAALLASERDPAELIELVVCLRQESPEILLSLGLASPASCALETLERLERVDRRRRGDVGGAAGMDGVRVAPAVHAEELHPAGVRSRGVEN